MFFRFGFVLTALPLITNALQSRDMAGKTSLPQDTPESLEPEAYGEWNNHCPHNFGFTCDQVVGVDYSCLNLEEFGWDCSGCICDPSKAARVDLTPAPTTSEPLPESCPKNHVSAEFKHYSCDEAISSKYTCRSLEELGWDCGGCTCILAATGTVTTATVTKAKFKVAWGGPLRDKRCSVEQRVGSDWGDLGKFISKEECLKRCAADEACKFVSYKTYGNQECTSFKSCSDPTSTSKHEIFKKLQRADTADHEEKSADTETLEHDAHPADTTDHEEKSADNEVVQQASTDKSAPPSSSCQQVNLGFSCDEKLGAGNTCASLEELGWDCSGCACKEP